MFVHPDLRLISRRAYPAGYFILAVMRERILYALVTSGPRRAHDRMCPIP